MGEARPRPILTAPPPKPSVDAAPLLSVRGLHTTYVTGFGTKNNYGSGPDVLRFASPDGSMFYSPQSGVVFPVNRSEVGLHAYGNDGHFVEYDDFGLQFGPGPGPVRKGFLMPVQQ